MGSIRVLKNSTFLPQTSYTTSATTANMSSNSDYDVVGVNEEELDRLEREILQSPSRSEETLVGAMEGIVLPESDASSVRSTKSSSRNERRNRRKQERRKQEVSSVSSGEVSFPATDVRLVTGNRATALQESP